MKRLTFLLVCVLLTAAVSFAGTSSAIFAFTPYGTQQLILNGGAIVLDATTTGWYDQTGTNNTNGPGVSNYIAGVCGSSDACNGNDYNYNDYFVFDLAGVRTTITSAQLSIGNNEYINPAASEVYSSWDVSTSVSTLIAAQSGQVGIYDDLSSGVLFASTTVTSADNQSQVIINLDAAALASLEAAKGGLWAIGGAVNASTGVPEPTSMALGCAGLIGLAVLGRRLRKA